MRIIILDGTRFTDRKSTHNYLHSALQLPDWYGRNLDALADCIGEWRSDTLLILQHPEAVERQLGDYGTKLLTVLETVGNQPGGFRYVNQK